MLFWDVWVRVLSWLVVPLGFVCVALVQFVQFFFVYRGFDCVGCVWCVGRWWLLFGF